MLFKLPFVTAVAALAAAAPPSEVNSRDTCTFTDASTAISKKKTCTDIVLDGIQVPAGTTLDLTGLQQGTKVTFKGNTTFGFQEWEGPLISVSGKSITVTGTEDHLISCQGERWWDGKGSSSSGTTKPKFFKASKLTNSIITGLNVKNTPVHGFSINSVTNLQVINVNFDNKDGDTQGGHNTDGFDVGSSTGVLIRGAQVWNQDDCLAINSGTNITFENGYCHGSHGLSIGSVGGRSDNTVQDVIIRNSTIEDSDNGVRIKTVSNKTGKVDSVRFESITLKNIVKRGIVIQQDYEDGKPTGIPTDGVPITNLTIQDVHGTVVSKGTNIYILCAEGACSEWTWSNISVTGGKTSTDCKGIPADSGAQC